MLKIVVTCLIWIGCFILMLPSDKPVWMAVLAGFGTYQVLSYFVYELYEIILKTLEIVEEFLRKPKD